MRTGFWDTPEQAKGSGKVYDHLPRLKKRTELKAQDKSFLSFLVPVLPFVFGAKMNNKMETSQIMETIFTYLSNEKSLHQQTYKNSCKFKMVVAALLEKLAHHKLME